MVEKLFGTVILFATFRLLDYKNISPRATKAAGAVTCTLTRSPSLIELHLLSLLKLLDNIL